MLVCGKNLIDATCDAHQKTRIKLTIPFLVCRYFFQIKVVDQKIDLMTMMMMTLNM